MAAEDNLNVLGVQTNTDNGDYSDTDSGDRGRSPFGAAPLVEGNRRVLALRETGSGHDDVAAADIDR